VSYWFGNDNRFPQQRLAIVSTFMWNDRRDAHRFTGSSRVLTPIKFFAVGGGATGFCLHSGDRARGRMLDRDGRRPERQLSIVSVLLLRDDHAQVEKSLRRFLPRTGTLPRMIFERAVATSSNLKKNFQPMSSNRKPAKRIYRFIDAQHRYNYAGNVMVHRRRILTGGYMAMRAGVSWAKSARTTRSQQGRSRPGDFVGQIGHEASNNDC